MSTKTKVHSRVPEQINTSDDKSMLECCTEKSQECVKKYPISSTMVALGAGAAVGLLVANAIGRGTEIRRQHYFSNLGNSIASSLGKVMPDSIGWNR